MDDKPEFDMVFWISVGILVVVIIIAIVFGESFDCSNASPQYCP